MKKLMIAAVASMAAVGAFAVESANIVGHSTKSMNIGGATMKGNSFIGMGETQGLRLTDLEPKGYENNQDLIDGEGTSGEFNIQTLTKLGKTSKMYTWIRSYDVDNGEWNDDGHWMVDGATVVPGSANDPVFGIGQGLWIVAPDYADDDGAEYSMTAKYPAN